MVYVPSATTRPAESRPSQAIEVAPPVSATTQFLTSVPSAARARTPNEPRSDCVAASPTDSRYPSPFGANHWTVVAAGVTAESCDGTVSTVTDFVADVAP